MPTAYLAGAMEFADDRGVSWRGEMTRWLEEQLGHSSLDPTHLEHDQLSEEEWRELPGLKERDLPRLRQLARRIVLYDARLVLEKADYLICYWTEATQRGCGTAGEITLAAWTGKPVHLVLDYPLRSASTWMIGCTSSLHHDFEDLRHELLRRYGGATAR